MTSNPSGLPISRFTRPNRGGGFGPRGFTSNPCASVASSTACLLSRPPFTIALNASKPRTLNLIGATPKACAIHATAPTMPAVEGEASNHHRPLMHQPMPMHEHMPMAAKMAGGGSNY
jgi:hypothetical protein